MIVHVKWWKFYLNPRPAAISAWVPAMLPRPLPSISQSTLQTLPLHSPCSHPALPQSLSALCLLSPCMHGQYFPCSVLFDDKADPLHIIHNSHSFRILSYFAIMFGNCPHFGHHFSLSYLFHSLDYVETQTETIWCFTQLILLLNPIKPKVKLFGIILSKKVVQV